MTAMQRDPGKARMPRQVKPAPATRQGRPPARVAMLALVAIAACSCGNGAPDASSSPTAAPKFKVTSTIDGRATLPHRIYWQALPGVPSSDISEVDFLIDGKLRWVERNPPYFYGSDSNYLVTSFLAPGEHQFTVRAVRSDGRTATDTVRATVGPAPAPPAALAGTWRRFQGGTSPGAPPPGNWRLVISSVGWQIYDTAGTGDLLDVAYVKPGLLEIRTGMFTEPDSQNPVLDGNGWCNGDPGPTIRLRYAVHGKSLTFAPIGARGCGGTDYVTGRDWRGNWNRVG
jgi:hypothetical protein